MNLRKQDRPSSRRAANGQADGRPVLSKTGVEKFLSGEHARLYKYLGAHPVPDGTRFALWAPNAISVSVIGKFNGWKPGANKLSLDERSGIWEGTVEAAQAGDVYMYSVKPVGGGRAVRKADPFAFACQLPPRTGSLIWHHEYTWHDSRWMRQRSKRNHLEAPVSIYEMHLGSWRWKGKDGDRPLTYREIAQQLPDYLLELNYTHVEFLPVMEHPFTGSWGYQTTGYFAPTSRFGSPADFMHLIDTLHEAGIAVILDWVPSHFPADEHGLAIFDGTPLYEHPDPRRGYQPDWQTFIFDYGMPQVRSFLISSAAFWLDLYHADGLRVDAVASMLYLDFSRAPGEWLPNEQGGNENLDAVQFLRQMNDELYRSFRGIQTMAEESTAWPKVSRSVETGGLGFGLKWDLGWMNDTLDFFARKPAVRRRYLDRLTFRSVYAFHENFVLPLSHDEVVYGKGSLVGKMPGDDWQRYANVRALLGYMFALPGKKLLFMGSEFGQVREWNHDAQLDWNLLDEPGHAGLQRWIRDLNALYRNRKALHELEFDPVGFEWTGVRSAAGSKLSFLRKGRASGDVLMAVFNFSSQARNRFPVTVPVGSSWQEVLNSDHNRYYGKGRLNEGTLTGSGEYGGGQIEVRLPPLSAVFLDRANP